ncbi:E3 ubiquitin-protein ligase TRIM38-like [Heteronotia binoei]|uniref:E3 ubiquitin-protein ligase TRIM38-like n=1 Tax=Heteronotia binoei TaxID=13085 RepID=UPI00292F3785|nr:E3 ubiquitin-protein ligase TRIM38-like [Heteronotia binoei]
MGNEDGDGTGCLQRMRIATRTPPKEVRGPTLKVCRIMLVVLLAVSVALKLYLLFILLQPVFQANSSEIDSTSAVSFRSCELAHRNLTEDLTLDPETAHYQLVLTTDGKNVWRGNSTVDTLSPNEKRFDHVLSILTHQGFTSGKHCWKVDTRNGRYWAMGVARESVRRKGRFNISPEEGFWAIQQWDGEYQALTSPTLVLSLRNFPRIIWVYLDYKEEKVVFFNAVTKDPIFTFPKASFSGERVSPWFAVWASGFYLTLLP